MAKIRFENGTVVDFNGIPTQQDIEEVAERLGISAQSVQPAESRTSRGVEGFKGFALGAGKQIASAISGTSELGQRGLRGTLKTLLPKTLEEKLGLTEPFESGQENIFGKEKLSKAITPVGRAEKAGFQTAEIAEFFIPGTAALKVERATLKALGAATKLKRTAGLGARATTEGGVFGGISALQQGEVGGEAGAASLIGAIFPVLGRGVGLAKQGLPKLMRFISPIDDAAFNTLVERGAKVSEAIKKKITPEQTLASARQIGINLRKKLTSEWNDAINAFKPEVLAQRVEFPKPIINLLKKVDGEFKTFDLPRNMKSITVKAALNLNTKINELYGKRLVREGAGGINVRNLQRQYREFLVSNFGGKGGAVDNMLRSYANKIKIFTDVDDIINIFKNNPKATISAKRNLEQVFAEGKVEFLDAIMQIEKEMGVDILSQVAGQKFAPILPSGISKVKGGSAQKKDWVGQLIEYLIFPFRSPRTQKNLFPLLNKASELQAPQTGIKTIDSISNRLFGR